MSVVVGVINVISGSVSSVIGSSVGCAGIGCSSIGSSSVGSTIGSNSVTWVAVVSVLAMTVTVWNSGGIGSSWCHHLW